ncbi:hypothetical protein H8959_013973, partial [Pygathrix nigripes]
AVVTQEPDVQGRCECQDGIPGDEGLELRSADSAVPVASDPGCCSDLKDPKVVTSLACGNGVCGCSPGGDTDTQEAKLSPAKLVRLFSTSRKRTSAHPERPRSMVLVGSSSTWNTLASFRKMGSFKKLKSSVLKGIQSREGSNACSKGEALEHGLGKPIPHGAVPAAQASRGSPSAPGPACGTLRPAEGGTLDGSDLEDMDDTFQRSTHRSRSLRRAYGLGRICLLDAPQNHATPTIATGQVPTMCEILVRDPENNSLGYRRSKSTDNLAFLKKSSFKRKSTSNLADLRTAHDTSAPRQALIVQDVLSKDCCDPNAGSQSTFDPEQPPTPLRPTTPKPQSPQSPGAGSAKCHSNHGAPSVSSEESDGRAEGSAQREPGPVSLQGPVEATHGVEGSKDLLVTTGGAASPEERGGGGKGSGKVPHVGEPCCGKAACTGAFWPHLEVPMLHRCCPGSLTCHRQWPSADLVALTILVGTGVVKLLFTKFRSNLYLL